MITDFSDLRAASIGSNELYDRMQREWFSDENSEIHEIVYEKLLSMSYRIAKKRFGNDPRLDYEDLAGEGVLHMLRKGMNEYLTNEKVKEMEPAGRIGWIWRTMENRMLDCVRRLRRRSMQKVVLVEETEEQDNGWKVVQTADAEAVTKRKSGKIKPFSNAIHEGPISINAENEEGSTIADMLADPAEIRRIENEELREQLEDTFGKLFNLNAGAEKILVTAYFWILRAYENALNQKGFNEWFEKEIRGLTLFELTEKVAKGLEQLDISREVLRPMVQKLSKRNADGMKVTNVSKKTITHWASDMRTRLTELDDPDTDDPETDD